MLAVGAIGALLMLGQPCSGDPCVIRNNPGGVIAAFVQEARDIRKHNRRLIIDGYCASACMTMADIARANACITPRAIFAYHRTNYGHPIPLSRPLHRWIMAHGGYPGFQRSKALPRQVAKKFWRTCPVINPARTEER